MSPKYPRTFHMPWSPGATKDDRIATDVSGLLNTAIVISEKCDGSNTSLEFDGCFARTHSGPPTHSSFDELKALHATIKYKIPENIQLFGEWCYALHSIAYNELPGYFLLFNVSECPRSSFGKIHSSSRVSYSWEMVETWAEEIGIPTVPVLFKGIIPSEKELQKVVEDFMKQPSICGGMREGVVVRTADTIKEEEFSSHVMKCVRANHVNPNNDHWLHQKIIKNKLKQNK